MWVAGKKKKKKKKKEGGWVRSGAKRVGVGGRSIISRGIVFFCCLLIVWEFGDCLVRESGVGVWVGVLADITPPLPPF